MTDITIPPEAVEAAARKIAAVKMGLANDGQHLPDDLWRQKLPEATAALRAGIAAWPRMQIVEERADMWAVYLEIAPLPQGDRDE